MEGVINGNAPTKIHVEDKPFVFLIFFLINLLISVFTFYCCLRKRCNQKIKYEIIRNVEMKEYDV